MEKEIQEEIRKIVKEEKRLSPAEALGAGFLGALGTLWAFKKNSEKINTKEA